jgi:dihydrofolate reductase
MIKLIVAHDENYVIGYKNTIPWKNSEDMKVFKQITSRNTIIMGRKTWDSLPKKPLPNRLNIVVTTQKMKSTNNVIYCSSISEACRHKDIVGDAFIIGGQSIYDSALAMDIVEEVCVSLIPGTHEGDTYFPRLDVYNDWIKYCVHNFDTFKQIIYVRNRGQLDHATY